MHFVCKLDKQLYSGVTSNIAGDEVIITDERVEHIKQRPPNDLEMYSDLFADVINDPDCILEGNNERTLLILKRIDNQPVKLILRLKTPEDPAEYKNSVLTFTRTDEKEWARILKKKQVFYNKQAL